MSGEQLPAVNTWVKLIEIILLIICTMATPCHYILSIGRQRLCPAAAASRRRPAVVFWGGGGVAVAFVGRPRPLPGGRSCGDSRWGRLLQVPDAVSRSGHFSGVCVQSPPAHL